MGAQFLFRTRDQGQTWDRISPDLTTNDPQKQRQEESGGVTVDNSSAEMHTTIYSISESPLTAGTIWVGTDDGNLQLTRDGGQNWNNTASALVRGRDAVPKASWVSWVEASRFDAATAYATFDRHTFGDHDPYLYVTRDYGKTWTPLVTSKEAKGIRGYAHVIKEDSQQANLLFLGTEFGLWVSIDGGQNWAQFKADNFPAVAVRDIVIQARDNDLVLATHGRGIWIVDDITPLRGLTPEVLASEAAFVTGRPAQQRISGPGGWSTGAAVFVGDNPTAGAVINYYQKSRHLFGKLKLEVLDADGKVLADLPASPRRGLNRVVWSMREKPPRVPPAAQLAFAGAQGPMVLPGTYTVRMTKGSEVYAAKIQVELDRRATYTLADRKAQYDAAMRVHHLFGEESALMDRILALRGGLAERLAGTDKEALKKKISALDAMVDAVRKRIVATTEGGAITGEERLREFTDTLYGAILSWEGAPTAYQVERIGVLESDLASITAEFNTLLEKDLPALNKALKAGGLPEIGTPPVTAVVDSSLRSPGVYQSLPASTVVYH
jgi:hypothetical protein